jgi:hypothetical protein
VVESGQLALMYRKLIRTYCEGQQTRLPKKKCYWRCVIFGRNFVALEVIHVVYVRTNLASPKKRRTNMCDVNLSAEFVEHRSWLAKAT